MVTSDTKSDRSSNTRCGKCAVQKETVMAIPARVKTIMEKEGLSGVNKPKKTPKHPSKSHVVMASEDGKYKLIRFGEQGASTAGKPKAGESEQMKKKRASFKARHQKNIKKGKMSAAYWANKAKW